MIQGWGPKTSVIIQKTFTFKHSTFGLSFNGTACYLASNTPGSKLPENRSRNVFLTQVHASNTIQYMQYTLTNNSDRERAPCSAPRSAAVVC